MAELINDIPDLINPAGQTTERFLPLTGPAAQPLLELGVTLSGISHMAPPYFIDRNERNAEHVLLFTLGGSATYRCETGEGEMRGGDLLILPAHQAHQYFPTPHWDCCWFHLRDGKPWSFLRGDPVHRVRAQFAERLRWVMDGYMIEAALPALESPAAALSCSRLIATYLRREFQFAGDPHGRGALYHLWTAVLAHLHHPWNVTEMAARAHCSVPTLYRLVARHHGERPMEMLTRLRMQRVKELLARTDYTLGEIADRVGYATPYALSRAYKRFAGHAPRTERGTRNEER